MSPLEMYIRKLRKEATYLRAAYIDISMMEGRINTELAVLMDNIADDLEVFVFN